MTLEEAARRFPIGQLVTFFPVLPSERGVLATIRSEPWTLSHGDIVIKITGHSGSVSIGHLRAEPMLNDREFKRPCGECHLQSGEVCDICGAERDNG